MGGTSSRFVLALASVLAAAGLMAGTASAGTTIEADPTAYTFLPGPYAQDLGERATFDNQLASTYHDVTAKRRGPDGRPLFYSKLIPGGQTTPVRGTEYLRAGTYAFYCTLHGDAMRGELTIDGSKGEVVRRPKIRARVPRQRLKRIRRAGVKVRVKGVTASKGVRLVVKKGKRVLGVKKGLSFRSGKVKTVGVKLNRAGRKIVRKAIRKRRALRISVRATVDFGKPAKAARRVR